MPPKERLERRKVLLQLLTAGIDKHETAEVMRQKYGMGRLAVDSLARRVEADLRDEDREALPVVRAKQVRRLMGHLARASADKSWNAVASLERLLAGIRGTLEPVQVHVSVDATVREAVVHVLDGMPGDRLRALLDGADLPALDVQGEAAE